jgi:hypothetical protein
MNQTRTEIAEERADEAIVEERAEEGRARDIREEPMDIREDPREIREDPHDRTVPATQRPRAVGENIPDVLLLPERQHQLRDSWLEIQGSFIDEPADSVRRADGLVREALSSVSERFEATRRDLERVWNQGGEPSTEAMRQALRQYRTLFNRLLAL